MTYSVEDVLSVRELAKQMRVVLAGKTIDLCVMACLELAISIVKEARGSNTLRAITVLMVTLEAMRSSEEQASRKTGIA